MERDAGCEVTPLRRWERLCGRLEELIEQWLMQTEAPGTEPDLSRSEASRIEKEWCQQLAAVSMAAQRAAGLRAMLIEQANMERREGESCEKSEEIDPEERRHWRDVESRSEPEEGSDEG